MQIQEQPFQVLLGLLEADGAIVKRAALHRRLWGTSTFVDFDQSLNSAVRRLRVALGDDSRQPVFVETISRIGFRFLPPVCKKAGATEERLVLRAGPGSSTASLLPPPLPFPALRRFVQHAKLLPR